MAELRRIYLGDGQEFCSLSEALDAFPETRFNIDVKSRGAVSPTVRAILDFSATNRVLVTSFDEKRRALSGLVAIRLPEKALGLRVTIQWVIHRVHALGLEMHVWTINELQRMRHLLDLRVDGIVTDRADMALEVVAWRA